MKKIPLVLVLISIAGSGYMGYTWFSNKNQAQISKARPVIPVEAAAVKQDVMARRHHTVGTLIANQSVSLVAELQGKVAKIFFTDGQEVKEGDPLIELESDLYKTAIKEAEAKLALSRVEYDRAIKLLQKKFGTAQARDKALANMKVNEAELESAKTKLKQTVIRAPFDGVVGLRNLSVGASTSNNQEMLSIIDVDPMIVEFSVPESFVEHLTIGKEVDVTVEGLDSLPVEASITAVDPKVDTLTHTATVRATINNEKRIFKPGMFAKITLRVGEMKDALLVPETAIERDGDEEYLFRVVEGTAVRTVVSTGIRDQGMIQILEGTVKAGDTVVVTGQFRLQDGYPVQIKE